MNTTLYLLNAKAANSVFQFEQTPPFTTQTSEPRMHRLKNKGSYTHAPVFYGFVLDGFCSTATQIHTGSVIAQSIRRSFAGGNSFVGCLAYFGGAERI